MTKPTVHLNGTGGAALSAGYAAAMKALQTAIEATEETAPNARDYYPQGEMAVGRAALEHQRRVESLRAIREELYQLYEAVEEQTA